MAHPSEPWRPASETPRPERPRYRPPVGMPTRERRSLAGAVVSVVLHALVVLLLVAPFAAPAVLREIEGAGGEGASGGGGGGTQGTGDDGGWGVRERLHFMRIAPPAAPAPPAAAPAVPPPPGVPPPVAPPPVPPPRMTPAPPVPPPASAPAPAPQQSASAGASAAAPGTGGGTGSDGSAGSGPGSGGGVGAGVGTGRGSGVGPGTGGGTADVYPPQTTEVFMPPLPVPNRVKGTRIVAVFDVDSTGRVLAFDFTQTPDGGYNRKLREALSGFRFRPGTRADGTPVRAKASLGYDL